MDKVTTLPLLAGQLAELTHTDEAVARTFLQQLFAEVTDALVAGESVYIRNIGTFSRNGIDPSTISFLPDTVLADAVNAPFAAFQPMEIDNSISDDDITAIFYDDSSDDDDSTTEPVAEVEQNDEPSESEPSPTDIFFEEVSYTNSPTTDVNDSDSSINSEEHVLPNEPVESDNPEESETLPPPFLGFDSQAEDSSTVDTPVTEPIEEPIEEPAQEDKTSTIQETQSSTYPSSDYYHPRHPRSHSRPLFGNWCLFVLGTVIGLLFGVGLGYFFHDSIRRAVIPVPIEIIHPNDENTLEESTSIDSTSVESTTLDESATSDKAKQVSVPEHAKQEPDNPVYDTVTRTRFLTTMAREHYGEMDYWVYIYMENSANLKNPDRISPGTQVVIPPIEKYVPDNSPANRSENIKKARKISAEIYSRYK